MTVRRNHLRLVSIKGKSSADKRQDFRFTAVVLAFAYMGMSLSRKREPTESAVGKPSKIYLELKTYRQPWNTPLSWYDADFFKVSLDDGAILSQMVSQANQDIHHHRNNLQKR